MNYIHCGVIISLLILLCNIMNSAHCSIITFTSDPAVIQTPLTPSLALRCGLNDSSTSSSGGLVGRRDLTGLVAKDHEDGPEAGDDDDDDDGDSAAKRDVSRTSENLKQVTSIVITLEDGTHVASITQSTPTQRLTDSVGDVTVSGGLTGTHEERGFLQVQWASPNSSQSGTYHCEVNALTSNGHNIVFSASLGVDATAPTVEQLAQSIIELNAKVNQLTAAQNAAAGCCNKVTDLQNQIAQLNKENGVTKTKMEAMSEAINTSRHIEHGKIECTGGSDSWNTSQTICTGKCPFLSVSRQFQTPYDVPPIVFLSISYWAEPHLQGNNYFYLYVPLERVDEFGFTMRCETYYKAKIEGTYVNWISFPA